MPNEISVYCILCYYLGQFWDTGFNMATITKRGDYQWQAKVRAKGFPSQSRTFSLKGDAERWAKETEIAIERGLFFDRAAAERTTLSEIIEDYRKLILPTKRGKHFPSALNMLEVALGQHSLASITSIMIAKHRDQRLAGTLLLNGEPIKKVSASTVKKEINLLSVLIDWAANERDPAAPFSFNPCLSVKRPVEPKGRERRLEGDELERLIQACRTSSPELEAIVLMGIETSARLSELLNLRWTEVKLNVATATLLKTKNGETRTIPLSLKAIEVLSGMKQHVSGRVFWRWAAADSFNKTWRRACERVGIKNLRYHDLRHEAVSRLFEIGTLDTMEVAAISGHKSLQMLKRYTHLDAQKLAKKLG